MKKTEQEIIDAMKVLTGEIAKMDKTACLLIFMNGTTIHVSGCAPIRNVAEIAVLGAADFIKNAPI